MFIYYKCYIMIELTSLKRLMLKKHVYQKSVMFATIGIFSIIVLGFKQMYAIDAMIC